MDVYDNAKSHSKIDKPKKPKFRRKQHSEISEQLVRVRSLFAKEIRQGQEELRKQTLGTLERRYRREIPTRRFEAIEAHCKCVGNLDMECIRFESPPKDDNSKCVCTYDRDMMVAWPCFNMSIWYDHTCPFCTEEGYCEASSINSDVVSVNWPCKCRNRTADMEIEDTPYCIGKAPLEIRKLWIDGKNTTIFRTTTTTTTNMATTTTSFPTTLSANPNQRAIVSNPETIKAMGFSKCIPGNCLEENIGSVGDFHHVTERMNDCVCKQRCREIVHEVTFSTSKWPSGATDVRTKENRGWSIVSSYYFVFYEQLNYELLQESEAYGLVNLIADFGGHLGLWLGFSVITVMEVAVLLVDVLSILFKRKEKEKNHVMDKLSNKKQGREDDIAKTFNKFPEKNDAIVQI
uniref:Degenerin del-1 n=1 Tax=Heterorhabditis bacteriophora TaxID=37862 RepID=A0A1I7X698_HETBA